MPNRLKIVVNTTSLGAHLTGIGWYTTNLLRQLLNHPDVAQVAGLSVGGLVDEERLRQIIDTIDPQEAGAGSGVRRLPDIRRIAANVPGARQAWNMIRHFQAMQATRTLEGYIYWEPNYLLLPFKGPSVATIHDVSHIRTPEYHPQRRVKELSAKLPDTVHRAQRLIAVSEFTRDEIESCLNPGKPIDIVSPAVDSRFFNVPNHTKELCKNKHKLPDDFILSVATFEPRKNLAGLIQAFSMLPEALRRRFPLVLAGTKGWQYGPLEHEIQTLSSSGQLIVLGYVEQPLLPALYALATASVYVSFYEGFGMPIAESMAAGTPVLTSNTASMPEVASGHALLCAPADTGDIRSKLETLLNAPELRARLAQEGRDHAPRFSWQRSADKLVGSLSLAFEEYHA
ncbi:MAG: hypothetical protein CMI01_11670 [Oceanospirillaceae bacterium]|nr:hypothetical protein [Oceanospirillaceae bacterium]